MIHPLIQRQKSVVKVIKNYASMLRTNEYFFEKQFN